MSVSEGLNTVYSDIGDSATSWVTVSNTGNTALSEVTLTDSALDVESIKCDQEYSSARSEFLPGYTMSCTITVPMTTARVDAGDFQGTSEVSCSNGVERTVTLKALGSVF